MSNYCERIYSDSEVKLIEEIFDMTIKQIYDDNLEELVLQCKELFLEHQKSLKEIEKLNAELKRYKSIVYLCEKVKDCDKE